MGKNRLPNIDMHVHTAGIGEGNSGCFISEKLRNSWKFPHFLKSFGSNLMEVEQKGDAVLIEHISRAVRESKHVDGAVVLAQDGIISDDGTLDMAHTEMFVPNDFLLRELKKYPELHAGVSINPHRPDALQELEQCAKGGAVLMKWIPSIMHIDPADETIIPFYEALKRLNLPLLTHTGDERTFTFAIDELCDPERLKLPLDIGVTVIAAHMASSGKTSGQANMNRLAPLFDKYPNLYGDISSLTQANRLGQLQKVLADRSFDGRCLYGTDYPLVNTPICSPFLHVPRIGPTQAIRLRRISNPFDQDVELKRALGMPEESFYLAAKVLGLSLPPVTT